MKPILSVSMSTQHGGRLQRGETEYMHRGTFPKCPITELAQ